MAPVRKKETCETDRKLSSKFKKEGKSSYEQQKHSKGIANGLNFSKIYQEKLEKQILKTRSGKEYHPN